MICQTTKTVNSDNNVLKKATININRKSLKNNVLNVIILKEKLINDNVYIRKSIGGDKKEIINNLLLEDKILNFSKTRKTIEIVKPEIIDSISFNDIIFTIDPIYLEPNSQKDKEVKWEVFSSDPIIKNIEVIFNFSYYYGVTVSKAEIFVYEKNENLLENDKENKQGVYYYDYISYDLYKNSKMFCSKMLDKTYELIIQLITGNTKNLIH